MGKYNYQGTDAFQEDPGTLCSYINDSRSILNIKSCSPRQVRQFIKNNVKLKHVVWFIDDERGNREWFRDYHREDFAVITFSSRSNALAALHRGMPCDAVVTDIFFPAENITSNDQANSLLNIYKEINETRVDGLHEVWNRHKSSWKLDGFHIARDLSILRPSVPVFLFSRKAVLILSISDFIGEPPAVYNSYWLIEKVDPTCEPAIAGRAAGIQRDRILALIRPCTNLIKRLFQRFRLGVSPSGPTLSIDLKDG